MSTKISQFDTATEVNNLTYVAAVVDNEDGTFTNKKVPYAILPHDLQSVTDAGNRTTTNITVGGDPGAGEQGVTIKADGVYFLDPTIGQTCHLQVPAGISDIDVTLPSSTGTLALLSDVVTPTLDAVLTEGNISAQPVFINDGAGTGSSVRTDGIFSFTGNVSTEIHPASVQNIDTDTGSNLLLDLSGTQIATTGDQQAVYQLEKWKINDTGISSTGDATGNAVVGADGVNTKQASESFSVLNADGDRYAAIRAFEGMGSLVLGNGTYSTTVIPDTLTISHVQKLQDLDGTIALEQYMTLEKVLTAGSVAVTDEYLTLRNPLSSSQQVQLHWSGISANNGSLKWGLADSGTGAGTYGYLGLLYDDGSANRLLKIRPFGLTNNRDIYAPDTNGTMLVGTKGSATLSSGTVTITDGNVKADSHVSVSVITPGGTLGVDYKIACTAGVGFTITSIRTTGATETSNTSTIRYSIVY